MPQEDELELLSIRQLKLVAEAQPQPYRIRVQVDANAEKETAQGKPYRELKLVDGADSLVWRVFDGNPAYPNVVSVKPGKWVELGAQWVDTGKFGLEPKNAALRYLEDEEVQALLCGDELTRERQQADFGDISSFISQMADPRLRGLAQLFVDQLGDRFRRAAAARDYHHARRGGLVEHVAQMMRSAVKISEAYPSLNRDLLVAGVLFHDCGKLWENNYAETSFTMPYSLHGEMVGHIALGMELVNKLWRQLMETEAAKAWAIVEPSNELVRVHLLHLIGSHHGEMQFGSPVLPKTPEAIVLHHVDNIDAKLEMFRRGYDTSREIGTGIYERVRPLPGNLVRPLDPVVEASAADQEPPAQATAS